MFRIANLESGRGELARRILSALPQWFGIPQSVDEYVAACEHLPVFAAEIDGAPAVGFVAIKHHTEAASEIYVMGVLRDHHRRGIGRALVAAAEQRAVSSGTRYLTVKTLDASDPDPNYAATRKFYEALGFEPLEVFPTLWSPENPCLLMIKSLIAATSR